MSDATVKLMDITSDMSSVLRAGADDGRATQRNGKEQMMSDDRWRLLIFVLHCIQIQLFVIVIAVATK